MTILIHQHGALVLSTLVLGLTVTAMDLTAQETVPSLLPGDRLRVYEVPPDSASSRVDFQPYSDDSIEGTAASRLGFEAKLDRIAGDTLVLSPLQSALIPRRVSLSNIERLEVQRSKRDLRVLWGLGYGTAVGAFLGFGGREQEGDEFLAAMTAWGAAVGVATAALARSDSRGKNALWGLMAGALVTGAVALAAGCDYECGTSAAFVGLGAGIGSGIGALVPPRRASWSTVRIVHGAGGF